jgi:hypothetical protein
MQQEKALCVLRFEVSRSVTTLEYEFHACLKNTLFLSGASFLNCARNSRCAVITDLDTSQNGAQKKPSIAGRHLGNWSCGPAVSMKSELLVAYEKF